MSAFHVDVPPGASSLDLNFQYLGPMKPQQGRISSKFADVTWNSALFYPAGYFSRRINFSTSIRLPEGWKYRLRPGDRSRRTATWCSSKTPP